MASKIISNETVELPLCTLPYILIVLSGWQLMQVVFNPVKYISSTSRKKTTSPCYIRRSL